MVNIKENPIKSNLGFVFSLLITLCGLWFYLFNKIKTISYTEPANVYLFFLGALHSLIFIFIIICLSLFFLSGLYLSEVIA